MTKQLPYLSRLVLGTITNTKKLRLSVLRVRLHRKCFAMSQLDSPEAAQTDAISLLIGPNYPTEPDWRKTFSCRVESVNKWKMFRF